MLHWRMKDFVPILPPKTGLGLLGDHLGVICYYSTSLPTDIRSLVAIKRPLCFLFMSRPEFMDLKKPNQAPAPSACDCVLIYFVIVAGYWQQAEFVFSILSAWWAAGCLSSSVWHREINNTCFMLDQPQFGKPVRRKVVFRDGILDSGNGRI